MNKKINIKDIYMGVIYKNNKAINAVVCMPVDEKSVLDLEHIELYPHLANPVVKRGVITYPNYEINNMIPLELLIKTWGYDDELDYIEIKQMLYKMNHDEINKVLRKYEKKLTIEKGDLLLEFVDNLKILSSLVSRYNEVYNQRNKKLVLSK